MDATLVSGLTAVAKSAGAVKAVIIARFFGAGSDLDAYLLAFLIPSFLAAAAMGILIAQAGGRRTLLACSLLLVMLPILPLSALSNVWRATLNANHRFAVAASVATLTPVVIVLSLMVAGRNVYWIAAGTTVGAAAETIALGFALCRLNTLSSLFSLPRWQRGSEIAVREYRSIAITNVVVGGSVFLDQAMAAMLGAGAVSILNYGTRLVPVLIAVGPEALGITLLPRFSQMLVPGGRGRTTPFLNRFVAVAMAGSAAVAGLLIGLSGPIVRLVFRHSALGAADASSVASVQSMSLLQLPFAVGVALLSRYVASARVNHILVPVSAAGLTLNAALNFLLTPRFAVAGIAMATTIAQAAVFMILLVAVSRTRRHEALEC